METESTLTSLFSKDYGMIKDKLTRYSIMLTGILWTIIVVLTALYFYGIIGKKDALSLERVEDKKITTYVENNF